jgi:hypothetical protein
MKISDLIYKIETENNVVNIKYKKIPLWLELRNRFFFKLSIGKESNLVINSSTILKIIKSIFYGFLNWFKNYDAWFLGSDLNRIKVNDKYYDKIFDYPADNFKKSLFLELSTNGHYKRKNVYSKYIVSRSPLIILEKVYSIFINTRKIDLNTYKKLSKEHKLDINPKYGIKKMISQYQIMKLLLFFKKPKYVFIAPSYNNYGYIKAFKDRGIKVIEIQHGVINKEHFGYNIYAKFDKNYFPDYILTFGEREKSVFQPPNLFINPNKVIPVGSFYIDYINYNFKSYSKNNAYNLTFSVSLQDCDIGHKVVPFIIEIAKKQTNNLFLLKPRRTSVDYYISKYQFPNNIKFIDNQDIYKLIKSSDIHITSYSTCALEAPALGKINILLNFENKAKEYYDSILNSTNTYYVENVEQFHQIIETIQIPSEEKIKESHQNVMYNNYYKNIDDFIKLLKNEK